MTADSSGGSIARDPTAIDLALQGGGAHGAFTWGVLDRLLEEPWLEIDGISGTSAGAMNAAVLLRATRKAELPARAAPLRISGAAFPRRPASAFSVAARSICCSAAGRWIPHPSI
jgi:NTE family protein